MNGYRRDPDGTHPAYLSPEYRSTVRRAPDRPLILLPHTLTEITGPVYGHERVGPLDHDLTRQHAGEPLGERIIVTGRVLDGDGRPGAQLAGRDLAVQRRRPLHPPRRPPPGAARPQLHRRRPLR